MNGNNLNEYPQKLGSEAHKVQRIISDDTGERHEQRALEIVEKELRELIGAEAERLRKETIVEKRAFWGFLLLKNIKKKEVNIDIRFKASRYERDPGKDIRIEILYPEDLKEQVIDLEIKSSLRGVRKHKERYKTPVILVKDNISSITIAKKMLGKIREHIRKYRASI